MQSYALSSRILNRTVEAEGDSLRAKVSQEFCLFGSNR